MNVPEGTYKCVACGQFMNHFDVKVIGRTLTCKDSFCEAVVLKVSDKEKAEYEKELRFAN
jgi:hypothetical protein